MMNNDLISRKALVAALIKEREQYPPMVAERYSLLRRDDVYGGRR